MGLFSFEHKKPAVSEQKPEVSGEESVAATEFLNRGSRDLRIGHHYDILAWFSKYPSMISKIPDYARASVISTVLENFKRNGYDAKTQKPPVEELRNKQDRGDRLILLALESIKDAGTIPDTLLKDFREYREEFTAREEFSELISQLSTIPAEDTNALLDWMYAYLKTKVGTEDYDLLKDDVLRAFEEKGYRPFVAGNPTASADSPRTTIEQSLSGIKDYGVVPQFFEVKYRTLRGK